MAVIMFDLFGTLIDKKKYDYNKALKWLADTYFDYRFKELQDLSKMFKAEYMKNRMTSYEETSFFEQLNIFEKTLNKKICDDYQSVELNFIRIFREERIIDGVIELLQFLFDNRFRICVLTNSLFSGDSLKDYLGAFEINKYFEKVYSSADIGFRKPAKEAFRYVLEDIGINNPNEVYYIGDSFEKDYVGALKSGLTPILLAPNSGISGLAFDNVYLLLNYFRDLY